MEAILMYPPIPAVPNHPLPRHKHFFFALDGKFLGAGTFELPNAQQWGRKRVSRVNTAAVVTVCTLE